MALSQDPGRFLVIVIPHCLCNLRIFDVTETSVLRSPSSPHIMKSDGGLGWSGRQRYCRVVLTEGKTALNCPRTLQT